MLQPVGALLLQTLGHTAHPLFGSVEVVEGAGDRDTVQPGGQPGLTAITGKTLEGGQEDLLHHVLGVFPMTDDPPYNRPDVRQVALDQAIERLAVSLPGALRGIGGSQLRKFCSSADTAALPASVRLTGFPMRSPDLYSAACRPSL